MNGARRVSREVCGPIVLDVAVPREIDITRGFKVSLSAGCMAALAAREVNVKEAFTVCDAAGAWYRASLTEASMRGGEALIYESLPSSPESPIELVVLVSILGRQRMLLVAQKLAELGAATLLPVFTEHSVQRGPALEKEKPWAWQGQGIKGSRQCRRGSLLWVAPPAPLLETLRTVTRDAALVLSLDDRATVAWQGLTVTKQVSDATTRPRVVLVCGPEGGFSDRERPLLDQHHATRVRVGPRVLRAETAVIVGATLAQHLLGDMR
jgi:16S rRNA (uracil1498-N3)-methyltransferase